MFGVFIAIVTANADDQDHTYRVKVRFPWMEGGGEKDEPQDSTHWARIATFHAGEYVGDDNSFGPRGAFFLPEIGDEVLVAFEHGDLARPIVIGRLWSDVGPEKTGEGKPNHPLYAHTQQKGKLILAVDDGDGVKVHNKTKHEKAKNDLSGFRTRSGHLLVFNDNKEEPAIYIRSSKKHRIEIVDGGDKGILIADPDDNYVWLKSGSAKGDIEIKTKGNITLDAEKSIYLKAKENIETTSDGDTKMTSKGTFQVAAKGQMSLKTDASGLVKAAAELKLSGAPINLN